MYLIHTVVKMTSQLQAAAIQSKPYLPLNTRRR